ncbi:MAG: histidinol-phosphate transaminase [Sphingobacteriaceae bacterium]|nr:histidinol-phosphate transaminase [Sphingobacteriaceae bacterium]
MFDLDKITRENIKNLKPYSSARDEYKGKEGVFLDANENSYGSPLDTNYNRYPDPLQLDVKEKLGKIKGLPIQNIFLGNGSDEAIDILFRAFCNPSLDNIIICPPTYGMYEVSANINNVKIQKVPLTPEEFQLDTDAIISAINPNTKLIFICCPNNPTGNGVKWDSVKRILENFKGIVVIDEAYINFARYRSLIPELLNYPNLVILQTLSKAWGLAGLRLGMAFASEPIIDIFNKIKPPYNINSVTQKLVIEALSNTNKINDWIKTIVQERELLSVEISKLDFVLKVYPSEANFILIKTKDALAIYNYLTSKQIIIRDRSKVELCEGCLRITVGTKEENQSLLNTLKQYK